MNAIALPNGLTIHDASRAGAETVYDEIFVRQVYNQNGIEINDGDVIVDCGANVGLFSLWLAQNWVVTIHAFEPVAETWRAAFKNLRGLVANVNNLALGAATGTFEFFACPRVSQWSSRKEMPPLQVIENLRHVERGMDESGWGWLTRRLPFALKWWIARRILAWHGQRRLRKCWQTTWSFYADANKVGPVDLFKIDVEGDELNVLRGIEDRHWPLIKQFVIETHSFELASACVEVLKHRGYKTVTDCNGLPMVYARRQ